MTSMAEKVLGNQTQSAEQNEPSSLKHNGPTPPPWVATCGISYLDETRQWIVLGVAHCGDGERSQANARLISAAPTMLAVLIQIVTAYNEANRGGDPERDAPLVNSARAAIAKATGAA